MEALSWISGVVLAIAFVVLAASNAIAVARFLRHRRHVSAIPVFGGLSGVGACFLLPLPGVRALWWLPLILDYGTLPLFIYFFASRIAASVRGGHAD